MMKLDSAIYCVSRAVERGGGGPIVPPPNIFRSNGSNVKNNGPIRKVK